MFRRFWLVLAAGVLGSPIVAWRGGDGRSTPGGRMVTVRAVDVSPTVFAYEPAQVTVVVGDTVRFIQASAFPHNVEFIDPPAGSQLGSARVGPYLLKKQQAYDVVIDARFVTGSYRYNCTPHVALGMAGALTVTAAK